MRHKPAHIPRLTQAVRSWRVARVVLWTIWVIYRERRRVIRAHAKGHYAVQPNSDVLIKLLLAFRHSALQLGGLMIKLGQFLSSRADLLPEQALAVLASLQDEVPPEPFSHVVAVIEAELGHPVEHIFSLLEPQATAAASLGQVHRAVLLATGEEVAVKVQRPHIEQLVRMDLRSLRFVIRLLMRLVDTGKLIDLLGVYREIERNVSQELDFVSEAAHCQRFQEMFAADPSIYIPTVYDEYTTRRVLVLEWIDGIKINDYAALEAAGIDRLAVAKRTVEAYFHQFFEEGFFHADPHPGNIFVQAGPPGQGPIIAFVDFGMVGSLSSSMKTALKELFLSFLIRDAEAMVQALSRLGFIGPSANTVALEHGLERLLARFYGMTLGEARELDFPAVAQEVGQLLYGQPFQIPAQFAYTGRAISTLVGVSTGLAPEFNFIDVAEPYARAYLGLNTQEELGKALRQLLSQVLETVNTLLKMPHSLAGILSKLERGEFVINLGGDVGIGATALRRHAGNGASSAFHLALALMFVACLAGAYFFDAAHDHLLAIGSLLLAAILGIRLFLRW